MDAIAMHICLLVIQTVGRLLLKPFTSNSTSVSSTIGVLDAVAESSKPLVSFLRVFSGYRPRFESSHGAHREATHVVDGGFGEARTAAHLPALSGLVTPNNITCGSYH